MLFWKQIFHPVNPTIMPKTFKKGGVHPHDCKLSSGREIFTLNLPDSVTVPLQQHIGAVPFLEVNVGDKVKAGQRIATAQGFVSSNIHAPISGTVKKIDNITDIYGYKNKAVVIERDGDDWIEGIDLSDNYVPDTSLSIEEIRRRINEAGIVGLGGATFPTHVKLAIPPGKTAEIIVVNGVECEPYLTCDHRIILEKGREILAGTALLMKVLNLDKAFIGIEINKPDAIKYMSEHIKNFPGIKIQPLQVKYPQGGEKQLIEAITGRRIPSGKIPVDVGVVPFNIASVFAIYEAVNKNKPLIERIITVTGPSVTNPCNLRVRIGTPVENLLNIAGGIPEDTGKIIAGGPMMGRTIVNIDAPVTKGISGLLLIPEKSSFRKPESNCIRCARCVNACPMGLEPYLLERISSRKLYDKAEQEYITDCIECGSCSFTCPANKPLLDNIRLGKAAVLKIIKSRRS